MTNNEKIVNDITDLETNRRMDLLGSAVGPV